MSHQGSPKRLQGYSNFHPNAFSPLEKHSLLLQWLFLSFRKPVRLSCFLHFLTPKGFSFEVLTESCIFIPCCHTYNTHTHIHIFLLCLNTSCFIFPCSTLSSSSLLQLYLFLRSFSHNWNVSYSNVRILICFIH